MSGLRIVPLAAVPEHVPALARAHVAAFGGLLPDWSVAEAEAELRTHLRDAAIPATWVALEGDRWLGSVSLLENDHAEIPQYSPWLASLYVCPASRGRGLGARLVAHCVAAAARRQVAALHLYCEPRLVPYYRALGWQRYADLPLGPLQVVVMRIETAPAAVA